MRLKIGLAATAAAVIALGVTVASANDQSFSTQVTIHKQGGGEKPTFHGNVNSGRSDCSDFRRVLIFDEDEDPSEKVGHAFTDGDGHWNFNAQSHWLDSGDYYAEVRHKDLNHSGSRSCEGDRSPSVRYQGDDSCTWKHQKLLCLWPKH